MKRLKNAPMDTPDFYGEEKLVFFGMQLLLMNYSRAYTMSRPGGSLGFLDQSLRFIGPQPVSVKLVAPIPGLNF